MVLPRLGAPGLVVGGLGELNGHSLDYASLETESITN